MIQAARFLRLLTLSAVLMTVASPAARADSPADTDAPEVRALWVDGFHDGFKTPQQVDQLIDDARRGNFNTLLLQVRRRGDAYQLKRVEPRTEDADLQNGFDPLQYTIDKAHAQEPRLEVHAWIATMPIWSKKDVPPKDPDHAFNRHGPGTDGGDYWLERRDDGETYNGEGYSLDPGNPDAASYITNVAVSLVRDYDIDGLHLDRVRYSEGNPSQRRWGYNMASVARFNDRYGRTGNPEASDPVWADWRREQLTELVRRIYLESVAVKPKIKISAAVIPWGNGPANDAEFQRASAYSAVFQDWRSWLSEGILDLAIPMNYNREDNAAQRGMFDKWIAYERDMPINRQIAPGLGAYLNSASATMDQVERARAAAPSGKRLAGTALYSYAALNQTLDNNDPSDDLPISATMRAFAVTDSAANRPALFPRTALIPDMPWKSADKGHLMLSFGRDFDGAKLHLTGPENREGIADGNGFGGFVDLPTGKYDLVVEHRSLDGPRKLKAEVQSGRVVRVDQS